MNYIKLISFLFITILGCLFTSCEETAEVDEFANWQERNIEYITGIAEMAEANADGKWLKILSFKLDSIDINGKPAKHDIEDYIYCHIEEEGKGSTHPLHTSFVSVNYRGRLIPSSNNPEGKIFDESYKGNFNSKLNTPRNFRVDELIVGWSTALMHMTKGDTWRVYIPAKLGYDTKEKDNIPAYSTLIFDMNLVDIPSITEK